MLRLAVDVLLPSENSQDSLWSSWSGGPRCSRGYLCRYRSLSRIICGKGTRKNSSSMRKRLLRRGQTHKQKWRKNRYMSRKEEIPMGLIQLIGQIRVVNQNENVTDNATMIATPGVKKGLNGNAKSHGRARDIRGQNLMSEKGHILVKGRIVVRIVLNLVTAKIDMIAMINVIAMKNRIHGHVTNIIVQRKVHIPDGGRVVLVTETARIVVAIERIHLKET